ncbi:hypothetical protein ACJ41O_014864 [Fusarium nematophilum]
MSRKQLLPLLLALPASTTASPFSYIGCISSPPTNFPIPIPLPSLTPSQCLSACSSKGAVLVALGGGSCFCDNPHDDTPVAFELLPEERCPVLCADGGKCGGEEEGVFSLWEIPGSGKGDCTNAEIQACPDCASRSGGVVPEETVEPVVKAAACPPEGCEPLQPTPAAQNQAVHACPPEGCSEPQQPTPVAQNQMAVDACPPGGCAPATPVPTPVPTPANNSTANACPPEGCAAPGDQTGDGSAGNQAGDAAAGSGTAGEDGAGAPALVSESVRLYTPGVLSAIVAVIFGLNLM